MKTLIVASVPTHYQYRSLSAFNLEVKKEYMNGSYGAWQDFDTLKEAVKFLRERAEWYYEGDKREMKKYYSPKEYLEIDTCTAYIITGERRKEFLESIK